MNGTAAEIYLKAITVKLKHREYHVISYYTSEDLRLGRLSDVSIRPDIMSLEMSASFFDLDGYRVSPEPLFGHNMCVCLVLLIVQFFNTHHSN